MVGIKMNKNYFNLEVKYKNNVDYREKVKMIARETLKALVIAFMVVSFQIAYLLIKVCYGLCLNIIDKYAVGIVDRVFMYGVFGLCILVIFAVMAVLWIFLIIKSGIAGNDGGGCTITPKFFSQQEAMTCSWKNGTIAIFCEDKKKKKMNFALEDLVDLIPGTYKLCYSDEQGHIHYFSIENLSEMEEKTSPLKMIIDATAKNETIFTIMKRDKKWYD